MTKPEFIEIWRGVATSMRLRSRRQRLAHLSTVPVTRPRSRRDAAPTPFILSDLQQMTRRIALDVRAGRHRVVIDPARPVVRAAARDGLVEVWLISWATEQAAELPDHAGSLGALTWWPGP